ncbi:MAG: homocysteine S-methyltransferase family protein [Chitinophagales bacterium]
MDQAAGRALRLAALLDGGTVLLDGALGTQLIAAGLTAGECPETWNLTHPEVLREVHRAYLAAGSQVITTNTFGGNRRKLSAYGLGGSVAELNAAGARLAREAAGEGALVAGSMGPTGEFVEPFGPLSFREAYEVFQEQAKALLEGGADFLLLETFSDFGEARAALLAARDLGAPVAATFTFDEHGRTLLGADPEAVVVVLQGLGAAFVGANCSLGPQELIPLAHRMVAVAQVPVAVQPNAGLPRLVDGRPVYPLGAAEFGQAGRSLLEAGVRLVGGCCGTSPAHISALAEAVREAGRGAGRPACVAAAAAPTDLYLAGPGGVVHVSRAGLPAAIGERLNPTARRRLADAVRSGDFAVYREEARSQVAAGAQVLDLNVGVPGVDEPQAMRAAVKAVAAAVPVPLSIDSATGGALAAGLEVFPGRALLNSVSGKEASLAEVLPLARRYGSAVLGLTLDERGIPARAEDRLAVARRIVEAAEALGLRRSDLLIDCLVLAAGAQQAEVAETLKAVRLVREELGVATVLGVSNVSHGLPARPLLNRTFLAMAVAAGLDAAIFNPLDQGMWETLRAGAVLVNRDPHARAFLASLPAEERPAAAAAAAPAAAPLPAPESAGSPVVVAPSPAAEGWVAPLFRAVVEGESSRVANLVGKALAEAAPLEVINRAVVPALEEVGRRYERGDYFLPQLMLAAEAARAAFAELKPHLAEAGGGASRATVVLATVEGDIHDIGKNIVAVMLENHGFRVVDLGKDVPARRIVEAVRREGASLVGLSALMTTTMMGMAQVIQALRAEGAPVKVLVGGAVVTEAFARSIGADGYGKDAVAAVRLAQSFTEGSRE